MHIFIVVITYVKKFLLLSLVEHVISLLKKINVFYTITFKMLITFKVY